MMTNKRAIEILTDYLDWLNDSKPLHWSAAEVGNAIFYAELDIDSILVAKVLKDYRDWLEFGQPFYHKLDNLIDALSIAIETLNTNNQ
jgi:hypothetical protein